MHCINEIINYFGEDFILDGYGYEFEVMMFIAECNHQLSSSGHPFYHWGVSNFKDCHRSLAHLTDETISACICILTAEVN